MRPRFQDEGFRQTRSPLTLIASGRYIDCLASPRSAQEFEPQHNGADADESPMSLDMAAGDWPIRMRSPRLVTELLIGNLWYLNYSDRNAAG